MDKLAFDDGSTKEQVRNVLNFKKTSRIIIVAAAVLVVVLSVGFSVNRAFLQSRHIILLDENPRLWRVSNYTIDYNPGH